jgi:uncharacterized membrane protein (UPF0127 family)
MPHFLAPVLADPGAKWRIRNVTAGTLLASSVEPAFDSESRRRGLLGRDGLIAGEALVIAPCNAIHTLFMRFPIDVVFVDRTGQVLKAISRLSPWRLAASLRAFAVIELAAGELDRTRTSGVDRLTVESDSERSRV